MPCAKEDRIIASKKVTQLYAKPVPFTTTAAASPLLSCSRVINPPSLPPIAARRSLLPRSISSKIRYGRSSAAEVLRSCPPRHCVPSSIPPSPRCEVMQVIFRYLVSHSKFWGESAADFISAERDFSDLGVEGRKRETEGGRKGRS